MNQNNYPVNPLREINMLRFAFALILLTLPLMLGCADKPGLQSPTAPETPAVVEFGPPEPQVATISPAAHAVLQRELGKEKHGQTMHLRLTVVAGGCEGYLHKLDLDPSVTSEDSVFEIAGHSVAILKTSVELVRGSTIDYVTENGKTGFKVINPNREGLSFNAATWERQRKSLAK